MRNKLVLPLMAVVLCGCSSSDRQAAKLPEKIGPAPATFRAKFETSKGDFVVEVTRELAPHGAGRFYELVKSGFYDDARFFRVLPTFMVQFGINKDPQVSALWREMRIPDDPVKESNVRGAVSFAMAGPG
ncbi:MAG: peptidylprolyl isomerase, partial [Pseudomonadota bacterium]